MPNVSVNPGTTFSDIYKNFAPSGPGRDDTHLRFSDDKGLYTHSKFKLSGWGAAARENREKKWSDGAAVVKQAVANEFGHSFANKAFTRLGITNEITRSDLDRIQKEVTRMKKTADSGWASENYQFLEAKNKLMKIDPHQDLVGFRQAFAELYDRYIDPGMPGWAGASEEELKNKPAAEINISYDTRVRLHQVRQDLAGTTSNDMAQLISSGGALTKAFGDVDRLLTDNTQTREKYWQHETADLDTIAENLGLDK